MRALLIAAALSACATPAAPTDPAAVLGCWIERRGPDTITQRWRIDEDGWIVGEQLTYRAGTEPEQMRYRLGGVEICPMTEPTAAPCRPVYFDARRSTGAESEWAEFQWEPERLKLTFVTSDVRSVLFDGARDGCD